MADKRGYMRYTIRDRVTLKDEGGALIVSDAEINGISFQGMSLRLKEKLEIGKIVCFEFTASLLGIFFTGKAVVKNVIETPQDSKLPFRTGVEFLEINKHNVSDLLNEIQRLAREKIKKAANPRSFPDYGPF